MNHLKAFAMKLLASFALLYMILGMLYNISFGNVFLITLLWGIISYLGGDLLILPRTNNTIATSVDYVFSLFTIWVLSLALTNTGPSLMMNLTATLALTVFEYFFHKLILTEAA